MRGGANLVSTAIEWLISLRRAIQGVITSFAPQNSRKSQNSITAWNCRNYARQRPCNLPDFNKYIDFISN